jgi:hypothetical protein
MRPVATICWLIVAYTINTLAFAQPPTTTSTAQATVGLTSSLNSSALIVPLDADPLEEASSSGNSRIFFQSRPSLRESLDNAELSRSESRQFNGLESEPSLAVEPIPGDSVPLPPASVAQPSSGLGGATSGSSTMAAESVATNPPFASVDQAIPSNNAFSDSPAIDPIAGLTHSRISESDALSSGLNFNEFPRDFLGGITLRKGRWAVKLGGYVKADLIHDFRAIDSKDFFDPATIPIGDPQRTNTRFHARQSRLNMDARWITLQGEPLRMMVEGDFFGSGIVASDPATGSSGGSGDTLRLRHAFGEYEHWIIGQTWTTFTHRAALPNTLDQVGDVASVGRRQAQVRFSQHLLDDQFVLAASIENPNVRVEEDLLSFGLPRSTMPDFISRLRFNGDNAQIQLAGIVRRLGFQPDQSSVITGTGSGLNATSYVDLTSDLRLYGGILWGQGIGNYRDLPDIALATPTTGTILDCLAWYSGFTYQWSDRWSSNLTYSQGNVDNTPFQSPTSIRQLQYFAVNLIWQPTPYTFAGTEYLWGSRMNNNLDYQDTSRVMVSFGFLLP